MSVVDAQTEAAEQLAEQSSPEPLPPRQRSRGGLGMFFQSHEEEETPTPSELRPQTGEHPLDDGSPSESEWPPDELDQPDEDRTSSPSPSDPASAKPLSVRAIRPMFRKGVQIGSGVAYRYGARTPGQQQVGLYLADEEDAAAIADPLASIAARHEGIAGKVSPDTADFISSMMGVAGYMSKQMVRAQHAAAIDAGAVPTVDPDGAP